MNIKEKPNYFDKRLDYFTVKHGVVCFTDEGRWNFNNNPYVNALMLSMRKWIFIKEYIEETGIIPNDGGKNTCALCLLYNTSPYGNLACNKCPIIRITGKLSCQGTPYVLYLKALKALDVRAAQAAAREEVIFLYKILKGQFK